MANEAKGVMETLLRMRAENLPAAASKSEEKDDVETGDGLRDLGDMDDEDYVEPEEVEGRGRSKSVASSRSSCSNGKLDQRPSSPGEEGTSGRFTENEKKTLFQLIAQDSDLFRAFLHQLTKRKWNGKSWMDQIAKRFNQVSKNKRKHDAVRHHLKLRKGRNSVGVDDQECMINLLQHSQHCNHKEKCSKCFQLHRLRVKLGHASCGFQGCTYCDNTKPFVLDPYDIGALLRKLCGGGDTAATKQPEEKRKELVDENKTNKDTKSAILKSEDIPSPNSPKRKQLKRKLSIETKIENPPQPVTSALTTVSAKDEEIRQLYLQEKLRQIEQQRQYLELLQYQQYQRILLGPPTNLNSTPSSRGTVGNQNVFSNGMEVGNLSPISTNTKSTNLFGITSIVSGQSQILSSLQQQHQQQQQQQQQQLSSLLNSINLPNMTPLSLLSSSSILLQSSLNNPNDGTNKKCKYN